jgi:hypothetical protein
LDDLINQLIATTFGVILAKVVDVVWERLEEKTSRRRGDGERRS